MFHRFDIEAYHQGGGFAPIRACSRAMTLRQPDPPDAGERGTISHISSAKPKPQSTVRACTNPLIKRLIAWLTPYNYRDYPGKYAIWRINSPGYAPGTIKNWIVGAYAAPPAMLRHWAQLGRAHIATGQQIVDELETLAAELEARPHVGTESLRRYRLKKRSTTTL